MLVGVVYTRTLGAMLAAALLVGTLPAAPTQLAVLINREFAASELWDDGQAEVATYTAERIIYGKARPHTMHLITVSEDFNREYWVKAEFPYAQKPLVTVLKQNAVATIPTDNYPYNYMTSLFVERLDPAKGVKLSVSSQEWCGTTSKTFQLWQNPPRMVYTSYWEPEGEGERTLGESTAFFEEQLFLLLRMLPHREGLEAEFALYPNQTTTKAPEPRPTPARLRVRDGGEDRWSVEVEAGDGRFLRFAFAKDYPHALLTFRHSDGRKLDLQSLERDAYWVQ